LNYTHAHTHTRAPVCSLLTYIHTHTLVLILTTGPLKHTTLTNTHTHILYRLFEPSHRTQIKPALSPKSREASHDCTYTTHTTHTTTAHVRVFLGVCMCTSHTHIHSSFHINITSLSRPSGTSPSHYCPLLETRFVFSSRLTSPLHM